MKPTSAPDRIESPRLVLRRPRVRDADMIFARYASDPEVTRYLAWPRHESVEMTRLFLEFAEAQWRQWPAGPYLIESRDTGRLLGSTGLAFDSAEVASTGYVLARDSWGKGFATEALLAIVGIAGKLGVRRLYADCHVDNRASLRVLDKGGFIREAVRPSGVEFPNLEPGSRVEAYRYAIHPASSFAGNLAQG